MTYGGSNQPRPSKNERREAAREKARVLREEQRKKDKRNRVLLQGGIIVAVLAIAAIVTLVIVQAVKPAGPGPRNMASDGFLIAAGGEPVETPALEPDEEPAHTTPDESGTVANIVTYVDYLCPFCGDFEATNGEQIRELVETGAANLEVHPISILANKSAGTEYSARAANAVACVADYSPENFLDMHELLFENQPEEGTAGLSNDELKDLAAQAGVSSQSAIESCIEDQEFKGWVQSATNRALSEPVPNSELESVTGTPTVLVNGQQYVGALDDPAEFAAFVLQATGTTLDDATSTPTPTPTP
jgi:protein-disulfide isomerase